MMKTTLDIKVLDTYRHRKDRVMDTKKPQYLDEKKLLEKGSLSETLDVSMGNPDFGAWENCFSTFDQLIEYLCAVTEKESPFRQRLDVDIVSNVMTLDLLTKWKFYKIEGVGEYYAVRKFGTIFVNKVVQPGKRRLDEFVNDMAKNLKYLLTLEDNGQQRAQFNHNNDEIRAFAVLKATLTSEDQKITVGYQALIDALDKDDNFVKIRVQPRSRRTKPMKIKYLGNFIVARLSNIHYTLTGNWVRRFLSRTKTERDWHMQTYTKIMTAEMPEKYSGRHFSEEWDEEKVMGYMFTMLDTIKKLLDEEGKSVLLTLKSDGTMDIDENPEPYDILQESVYDHFKN